MHSIIRAAERMLLAALPVWLVLWVSPAIGQPSAEGEGRFGFSGVVEGVPFEALFTGFRVTPSIDPAGNPIAFLVEIDMTRIDSGDAERDTEMAGPDWFDVANYPRALFRSTRVLPASAGSLTAVGELTIKDRRREIEVPFSWAVQGGQATMRGEVRVDRRWFAVGNDDVSSVAAEAQVFFDLRWDRHALQTR